MPDNKPTAKYDLKKIKREVGRKPFDDRVQFTNNHCKCPFHNGDTNTSMSIFQHLDGTWMAKCHSECNKSWDAIGFVMAKDNLDFKQALAKLIGEPTTTEPKKRITWEEWLAWGREITPEDIERFAKSRKDKTASFDTFKSLGCRVKDDWLGFPYLYTDGDTITIDAIKKRRLDGKVFDQENCVSSDGLFNIDTVNPFEDVYIVEGEPDVAVMEEAGFRAVSVKTGAQKKINDEHLRRLLVAPRIFLVGDQAAGGDPGQCCMDNLQKLLPPEKTFRIRFTEAHDVCGLASLTNDGFAERIEQLRDDSETSWVVKNLPSIGQLSQKPVEWAVDRMLPYGCLTMFAGAQGSMKSMLGLYAAQAIAAGKETFLGRKVKPGIPVLYIDRENPEGEVANRARSMGILVNKYLTYWGDFSEEQTPELDDPRILEFAHRQKGFVVFDSLQDWYPAGFNENDNAKIVELMGKIRRIARAGAGVLLLHHNAKYGQVARGGTAFVALTDMAIKVGKSEGDKNVIQLREERFRMCGAWELDFRAHWDAGESHGFAKHYQLELLKDEGVAEAMRAAKLREADEEREQATKLDALLTANPEMSLRGLGEKLGVSAPTAKAWAKKAGWSQEGKLWRRSAPADEALIF